jgi:hypothetical protein
MAITKSRTSIWSAQTLTAGAGNTNSSWIDLSAVYSAEINFDLVNGGTGPTIPAQVQIQVANDYNGGAPTLPVNYGGPMVAGVGAATTYYFSCELPPGVAAVRLVAGSNTVQNVTVNADISTVTAI